MMKNNKNKGFTLVEILVSLFVFSLLSIAISGIYIAFSKAQANTKSSQELLNDMQYSMEMMTREIRNNEIIEFNPDCSLLIYNNYSSCILLKREDNSIFAFAVQESESGEYSSLYYLDLVYSSYIIPSYYLAGSKSKTKLLDEVLNNADINSLIFKISPSTNPYNNESINQHPRVTIGLKVDYISERETEQVSYFLQTTVSSRIYRR